MPPGTSSGGSPYPLTTAPDKTPGTSGLEAPQDASSIVHASNTARTRPVHLSGIVHTSTVSVVSRPLTSEHKVAPRPLFYHTVKEDVPVTLDAAVAVALNRGASLLSHSAPRLVQMNDARVTADKEERDCGARLRQLWQTGPQRSELRPVGKSDAVASDRVVHALQSLAEDR